MRLDSWKEIAAYLRRDVRTAQRWEKNEGLPVHRHRHGSRDTVFALASEIDAWLTDRSRPRQATPGTSGTSEAPSVGSVAATRKSRRVTRLALAAVAVAIAATLGTLAYGVVSAAGSNPEEPPEGSPRDGQLGDLVASPARESWAQGRYLWNKGTAAGFRASLAHFEKALELDPTLVDAHVGLASAYASLGRYGAEPADEVFPLARAAAQHALDLEPDAAEAHVALATVRFYDEWDFAGAAAGFRAALDSEPDLALAHHAYAHFLSCLGLHDAAEASARTARRLEPLSPLIVVDTAWLHYRSRDFEGAVAESRRALELEPGHTSAILCLVASLERLGEPHAAWAEMRLHLEREGVLEQLGELASATPSESLQRVREWRRGQVERMASQRFVSAHSHVFSLLAAGRDSEALAALEAAAESRDRVLLLTQVHPAFDRLRDTPRFLALVARVGFPSNPTAVL